VAHERIACPHYVAPHGSRRCESYLDGGGCARADTFMCTEWLRKNGRPNHAATLPVQRTLFGDVTQVVAAKATKALPVVQAKESAKAIEPQPFTRPISDAQIEALEQRGIELCVRSAVADALWLVPAYTHSGRNEMTFRDAATVATVCAVFPGAEVTRFVLRASQATPSAHAAVGGRRA
jgi:hypothetical protein